MARHLAGSAGQPQDELSALLITNDRTLAELYQLKLSLDGYELRSSLIEVQDLARIPR